MKAARFDYLRPPSVTEALSALAEAGSRPVAGSQSLGPMLNLRLARPARLVDISRLSDLGGVDTANGWLRIGAAVTHAQIEDGVFPALAGTPLGPVAAGIAYRAIRNRGTLGGSLAHADPAADWLLALQALAAEVEMVSAARGSRRLPVASLAQGAYATALADDELLVAVWLPAPSRTWHFGYHKFCRKPGEFAHASCAAMLDRATGRAAIVIGALDGPPRMLPGLAASLAAAGAASDVDDALDGQVAAAIAEVIGERDPTDRQLHAECVRRCLAKLAVDLRRTE